MPVVGLSKKQRKRRRDSRLLGSGTWWRRWRAMAARLGLLCMTPSMGQSRRRGAGAGQSCTGDKHNKASMVEIIMASTR